MSQGLAAQFRRFLGFAAVGGVGTLGHYALLVTLVEWGGADPVLGSVAGFLLGALINYSLSRTLVFASSRPHREALPRFLAVAGSGLVFNTLLMSLLTHGLEFPYLWAQILVTGLLLFWHYAANAIWTFARKHEVSHDHH